MTQRLPLIVVSGVLMVAFCFQNAAFAYGPGPRMTLGQNGYYNTYGQGYYGGQNNFVNGPGFSEGYGTDVNNYPTYGFGAYGYGNSGSGNYNVYGNANGYGNTGNSGQGFSSFYSPYGWGTYSRFSNGW